MDIARLVTIACALAGCGRIDFDELVDDSCWPLWRAGVELEAPVSRADLNTSDLDKNAWLTADGREMYFATDRPGGQGRLDFWLADRADGENEFVVRGPIAELSGAGDEGRIELDRTGLFAVISTNSIAGGAYNLYLASRPDTASPFVVDESLTAALHTEADEKDPHFLSEGTTRFIYTSGSTAFRIANRVGNGAFFESELLLDTAVGFPVIADPHLSPDERTLVFSAGPGSLDLYVANRESVDDPFIDPVPLTALNTPSLERDLTVTADGCEVWFARAAPDDDIWASRVVR